MFSLNKYDVGIRRSNKINTKNVNNVISQHTLFDKQLISYNYNKFIHILTNYPVIV